MDDKPATVPRVEVGSLASLRLVFAVDGPPEVRFLGVSVTIGRVPRLEHLGFGRLGRYHL